MSGKLKDIRNLPSTTMTLSRRGPKVVYIGTKLCVETNTQSPRVVSILRSLADGQIVRVF